MSKFFAILKRSYIYIILAFVYIPLVVGAIFSFNPNSKKGGFFTTLSGFTTKHWATFLDQGRGIAIVNSIIIAVVVSIIVIILSLITAYSIYRQKTKFVKAVVTSSSNIPLINPDNITAIGLVLVFGVMFGIISSDSEGIWRAVVAQVVMALPYGISLMLPRSEKFNWNLYEASQDLGYSGFRSWFKTYFVYMIPSIIFVFVVSSFLSFDDFIITRTVSNTTTIGVKLYEGTFQPWALVLGTIFLLLSITGNFIYIFFKKLQFKKSKVTVVEDTRKNSLSSFNSNKAKKNEKN